MADGRERFVEVACEIVGEKSPFEIRAEELEKLVTHQTIDMRDIMSDPLVKDIFDDPEFWDDEE